MEENCFDSTVTLKSLKSCMFKMYWQTFLCIWKILFLLVKIMISYLTQISKFSRISVFIRVNFQHLSVLIRDLTLIQYSSFWFKNFLRHSTLYRALATRSRSSWLCLELKNYCFLILTFCFPSRDCRISKFDLRLSLIIIHSIGKVYNFNYITMH